MSFYPPDRVLPRLLQRDEFVLVPLTTGHVAIDYEAVMDSRIMLRRWSGEPWPRDDFTLQENRADLQRHQREHAERIAFTYTALAPQRDTCIGCVYILPLINLAGANPGLLENCLPDVAMVRFWVRANKVPPALDQRLLGALCRWFADSWTFPQVYFHTRVANTQQVALFEESDLHRRLTLEYPGRGGRHHFYLFGDHT